MSTSTAPRSLIAPVPLPTVEERRLSFASLPRPLTSFIGRERESEDCRRLLLQPNVRLLTLTGAGGSGKTRLAIHLAGMLSDAFADIWFISLSAIRDPELVVPTIAQSLGVRISGSESATERIAAALPAEPGLLILDNFEQVILAAPSVTELLVQAPSLKILVTSREALHVSGEHDYLVSSLEIPRAVDILQFSELEHIAAVSLFVERARAANDRFRLDPANAVSIVEICRRLDGLPLAIELAASQSRVLSPIALVSRLTHRLELLTGGPRDQPSRLRSMRSTIAWSYDLLDPDEQALFRRLSVFVDGCTSHAIESVCLVVNRCGDVADYASEIGHFIPGSSIWHRLSALVDKSLIRQEAQADGEPRFHMLETIREYAADRLAKSGEEPVLRAAHAHYYVKLAQDAEPLLILTNSGVWVERLAIERANLRAAVEWLLASGHPEPVLRLAGTILSLVYARGEPSEGLNWLESALAIGEGAPVESRVDALFTASALSQVDGDLDHAIDLTEQALALARQGSYRFGEARALVGLGISAEWQGNLDNAADFYEHAAELMAGADDRKRLSHWKFLPLANLADLALVRGDYARACGLAGQAVCHWRKVGYVWGIAQALGTVAAASSELGDQSKAAACYEETLDLWLASDDGRGIAGTIAGIANLARAYGQNEPASRLLGAAWGLSDSLGVQFLAHHLYAEKVLAATRERTDPAVFSAAWAEGRAMSLEDAVAESRATLALSSSAAPPPNGLTTRELDVLRLIVAGHPDREIAATLSISPRTVQTHVANLFDKIDASTRAEAAAIAIRKGLV